MPAASGDIPQQVGHALMKVVFEFCGGPRDGQRVEGLLHSPPCEATSFYERTGGARVGATFWCTCEYATGALRSIPLVDIEQLEHAGYRFRGHVYQVSRRVASDNAVVALARYLLPSE